MHSLSLSTWVLDIPALLLHFPPRPPFLSGCLPLVRRLERIRPYSLEDPSRLSPPQLISTWARNRHCSFLHPPPPPRVSGLPRKLRDDRPLLVLLNPFQENAFLTSPRTFFAAALGLFLFWRPPPAMNHSFGRNPLPFPHSPRVPTSFIANLAEPDPITQFSINRFLPVIMRPPSSHLFHRSLFGDRTIPRLSRSPLAGL